LEPPFNRSQLTSGFLNTGWSAAVEAAPFSVSLCSNGDPMHDFFVHPKTRRTDWWTIAILLLTVASFAGAGATFWMK
jgi:hypothetical protein